MTRLFALACILICSIGCGPGTGVVSGEAVYKGKPVPGGLLTFRPADPAQNSVTYELDRDGKFSLELPVGEATVCIDNREFEPRPATAPAIPPGMSLPPEVVKSMQASSKESTKVSDRWVKLPEKYYQLETSDLKITVKGGPQTEVIEFKD
ncbi:MAG: hypothetical protein SFV81_03795 [Pirellulaceae bacterium]|nr:hypothetical protein [Pirellulaceae bacterium]